MTSVVNVEFDAARKSAPRRSQARPTINDRVLILEDDDFDAAITTELLEKFCTGSTGSFVVERAAVLKDALRVLARADFSIVLTDMNVPDSSGLNTVKEILQASPHVPVIVLSGSDDMALALEALHMGAQDYLAKSELDSQVLQRATTYSIHRKKKETDLTSKAYYDSLTGIANRALLHDRWCRSLARSKRAGRKTGVVITDIDRFKQVNDTYGHEAGDQLLTHYAGALTSSIRETDMVARLGGDEFVIVLENIRDESDMNAVLKQLTKPAATPFIYEGQRIDYTSSLGSAISNPEDNEDLMAVLKRADIEMYRSKAGQH